jgi:hypothetical protein
VEKAIKERRNKKATGDDDVPEVVLKLLGEGGLKIMTMIALKKKPQAIKCSDHRTISPTAHTAKIVTQGRRIERKVEDVLGEDQFVFRRGKGTRDAYGDTDNNIRTNLGDRCGTVCLLHRLAEGV